MITHSHTATVCRIPPDEGSARRRDLYLTTHNTHNRQTSMPPAGFEPAILAGDRLQTHALYRSATGIGWERQVAWYSIKDQQHSWLYQCTCFSSVPKILRLLDVSYLWPVECILVIGLTRIRVSYERQICHETWREQPLLLKHLTLRTVWACGKGVFCR